MLDVSSGPWVQVGTEFTRQYYHVMANTPDLLHRFYTETSTLTYINQEQGGEKTGSTVQGQTVSLGKLMSLSNHWRYKI